MYKRQPFDDGVREVVGVEARLGEVPLAGLGEGIALGVGHVQLRDRAQVRVVEAVSQVVFVRDGAEHVGPHVGRVFTLVPDPRCGAEELRRLFAGDVALLLDSDHQCAVVSSGFEFGHRGEDGHTPRRARGFVSRRGHTPEPIVHRRGHGAQLSLAVEELSERVADVNRLHVGGVDLGVFERAVDDFGDQVGNLQLFAVQVS